MPNRIKPVIKGPSAHAAPKREVIAKAERRFAKADKQRAGIKAIPNGRLPASDCASSAPRRRSLMPKGRRGEERPLT